MTDTNDAPQDAIPAQPAPVSIDLKRRMRELLSIPDSQRNDEQWDELIEIEIQLAPGNRVGSTAPRMNEGRSHGQRSGGGGTSGGGGSGGPGGGAPGGGNWKRHGGANRKSKPGGPKKPAQPGPGAGPGGSGGSSGGTSGT